MPKKFINEFELNKQVDSCFLLRKKNLKLTKYNKYYLELSFSDKTGNIEGRLWDDAERFNEAASTGDIVRVKGTVDQFKNEKQLKVDLMERADESAYKYEDMVRVVDDGEKIFSNILKLLDSVKDPWITALIAVFRKDERLMKAFMDGIGAKSWHNAYIGGLMEHTYEVMFIADRVCSLYSQADRDITIFGSFMHDMGKVEELDPRTMEYTVSGGLLGHIAIGYRILMEKIKELKGFPPDLALRLGHIILSHHGEYEQQSPVLPKTLEATIVYQTDELVSQANAVKEIMASQSEEGRLWSNYVSIKNRKYYISPVVEGDTGREEQENPDG